MKVQKSINRLPITEKLQDILFRMYLIELTDKNLYLEMDSKTNELVFQTDVMSLDREQCTTLCEEYPWTEELRHAYRFSFTLNGIQIRFKLGVIK